MNAAAMPADQEASQLQAWMRRVCGGAAKMSPVWFIRVRLRVLVLLLLATFWPGDREGVDSLAGG